MCSCAVVGDTLTNLMGELEMSIETLIERHNYTLLHDSLVMKGVRYRFLNKGNELLLYNTKTNNVDYFIQVKIKGAKDEEKT